jgi:hypothetical protein
MEWTPDATIRNALWIGGGQWAGKTTVARSRPQRHGLTSYHYDAHAARGHADRRTAALVRRGERPAEIDWESYRVGEDPRETAKRVLAGFPEYFAWVLDDLRALAGPLPIVAEGWGLRPELVAGVTDPRRMVVLAPTDEWQERQAVTVRRAGAVSARVSDPARAQRNRIARDRLITADAVSQADRLGTRVITVDGSKGGQEITDQVADHFSAFLSRRRRDR